MILFTTKNGNQKSNNFVPEKFYSYDPFYNSKQKETSYKFLQEIF